MFIYVLYKYNQYWELKRKHISYNSLILMIAGLNRSGSFMSPRKDASDDSMHEKYFKSVESTPLTRRKVSITLKWKTKSHDSWHRIGIYSQYHPLSDRIETWPYFVTRRLPNFFFPTSFPSQLHSFKLAPGSWESCAMLALKKKLCMLLCSSSFTSPFQNVLQLPLKLCISLNFWYKYSCYIVRVY